MNTLATTILNDTGINSSIDILKGIFTIILALAVGEALKQFVPDKPGSGGDHEIDWSRLPALLSFLVLIVPFDQGMLRYMSTVYGQSPRPSPYSEWLFVDCAAFTVEASLFFILSRSLAFRRWTRFYGTVLVLLAFDALWAIVIYVAHTPSVATWIWLDALALPIFGGMWLFGYFRYGRGRTPLVDARAASPGLWAVVLLFTLFVFVRAAADYSVNYKFYFPPEMRSGSPESSKGSITAPASNPATTPSENVTVYFAGPLFTQGEWRWNSAVAAALRDRALSVILPQEGATPMLSGAVPLDPARLYFENLHGIEKADVVVAVLDGADADSGTCFECGYAVRLGLPVIGIRTDIRRGGDDPSAGINLMLSRAAAKLISVPVDKRDDIEWVANQLSDAVRALVPRPRRHAK